MTTFTVPRYEQNTWYRLTALPFSLACSAEDDDLTIMRLSDRKQAISGRSIEIWYKPLSTFRSQYRRTFWRTAELLSYYQRAERDVSFMRIWIFKAIVYSTHLLGNFPTPEKRNIPPQDRRRNLDVHCSDCTVKFLCSLSKCPKVKIRWIHMLRADKVTVIRPIYFSEWGIYLGVVGDTLALPVPPRIVQLLQLAFFQHFQHR